MSTSNDFDHYVECAECGQPIERHDRNGLGECRSGWTEAEIKRVRKAAGLPMKWDAAEV